LIFLETKAKAAMVISSLPYWKIGAVENLGTQKSEILKLV